MSTRSPDRVLWIATGLVALVLLTTTVLMMQRAGILQRWSEAVEEQWTRSEEASRPDDEKGGGAPGEAQSSPAPTAVATALPGPERILCLASRPGVPDEEAADQVDLWAVSAAGGDAELLAELARADVFGTAPPWSVVDRGGVLGLAYVAGPRGSMRLMALDLRSGEQVELYAASDGRWIASPSASPDGELLAFITVQLDAGGQLSDELQGTMHVIELAAGEEKRRFEPATLWTPLAWSDDSRWLAAVEAGGGTRWPRLTVFPAGEEEPVTPPFSRAWLGIWLPDELRLLAVQGQTRGGVQLVVWDPVAGTYEPFALQGEASADPQGIWNLTFSPDGSWLAGLAGEDFSSLDLYVVGRDGGEPRQLSGEDVGSVAWYRWSPDGRQIAFAALREAAEPDSPVMMDGYVSSADGAYLWQVNAGLEGSVEAAAWAPDGQRLAFALHTGEDEESASQLYVMDSEEQRPFPIHEGMSHYLQLLWLAPLGGG